MIRNLRLRNFFREIQSRTAIAKMALVLVILWLVFSTAFYFAEVGTPGGSIKSYADALYWGVAAFSTAGIANAPLGGAAQIIGGVWSVLGSILFFGIIVATVTAYFMRPLQRPGKQIIETIEYNLEQLGDLTVEELDLLKDTIDALIVHMEHVKKAQDKNHENKNTG